MQTQREQQLTLLQEITKRREVEITERWRNAALHADKRDERELCAADLRALGELANAIEEEIGNERRRTDK